MNKGMSIKNNKSIKKVIMKMNRIVYKNIKIKLRNSIVKQGKK